MSNKSNPEAVCPSSPFIAARSRRLARFRLTAFPTASPALTPTRTPTWSDFITYNTTSGWAYDLPERRTRLKSVELVRRKLRFTCSLLSGAQIFHGAAELLPANVLYVIIAADGQPEATLQATPLEHDAAIGSGHALAKAMDTYAPADLGLIRTFCCHLLSSKKIIKTPNSGPAAGVFVSVPTQQRTR